MNRIVHCTIFTDCSQSYLYLCGFLDMKNIVVEVVKQTERRHGAINMIVNRFGGSGMDDRRILRELVEELVEQTQKDILDIHENCLYKEDQAE